MIPLDNHDGEARILLMAISRKQDQSTGKMSRTVVRAALLDETKHAAHSQDDTVDESPCV